MILTKPDRIYQVFLFFYTFVVHMFKLKKHLAFLGIIVLLIPSAVQFLHAHDNHEHTVCVSKKDKHFHEKDFDCSKLHYPLKVYSYDTNLVYSVTLEHQYKSIFNQHELLTVHAVVKKSPRAPPFVM
ncbi:conserved protein of unknown function [Tenacibaculum sp. 190524A02b]|uniref:DUF2607 family protein n=2 Tax=Tenacibaculum vairaonense TaxID=3137860 RepID=A0ABP1FEM2_9FLAO